MGSNEILLYVLTKTLNIFVKSLDFFVLICKWSQVIFIFFSEPMMSFSTFDYHYRMNIPVFSLQKFLKYLIFF